MGQDRQIDPKVILINLSRNFLALATIQWLATCYVAFKIQAGATLVFGTGGMGLLCAIAVYNLHQIAKGKVENGRKKS